MKPVTIDNQAYLCPTWQDMGESVIKLAKQINDSNQSFDRVIALAKGGLSWNRQLQDLLQIPHTSSIQVTLYKGINEKKRQPIVVQSLPVTIQNESILLFDDIADTGESLKLSIDYLKTHGAKSIKTACMFSKPWTTITPDFYAHTTEAWVMFPHDTIENIKLLKKSWSVSDQEFIARLKQLGSETSIIDYYLASSHRA